MSISAINGASGLQSAPPTERPRQEPTLDNDRLTQMATRLQSLASTLGVNSDDLPGALQSGADLSTLLGSATQSPYGTTSATVDGGVVVDEYV